MTTRIRIPARRSRVTPKSCGPLSAPSPVAGAEADFLRQYPDFDPDGVLAELRRLEYGRLDAGHHVYLDYTGAGLHAASQIHAHFDLLQAGVLGNPHSNSPASQAATDLVERTRGAVRAFFNASPDDYLCIFTANATGALRLVGESYRFAPGTTFALTADNHNSVNGIREFARRQGAEILYAPVRAPDLRLDRPATTRILRAARPGAHNLFAFPAQSNFSGVQHPLDLIDEAHAEGWDVLVDVAAFAPTNRFDAARIRPDFATISFYKIMGFPTGVGCLLMRRDRLDTMARPWFAGGTVTIASVQGDGHYLRDDEAAFEDGTVDYLNLSCGDDRTAAHPADRPGRHPPQSRVPHLLDARCAQRAASSQWPSIGRTSTDRSGTEGRGGTITFSMHDRDGLPVDDLRVQELANEANISLRTGCFCNPGAAEAAHHLSRDDLRRWFGRRDAVSYLEFRDQVRRRHDQFPSAIRISFGVASNFADAYRLVAFLQEFVDRSVAELDEPVLA